MWVPDADREAMRDLTRAREDMKAIELKARQRLGAFLLRHERIYAGRSRWTQTHFRWLEEQSFEHPVQQVVFQEYVEAVLDAQRRVAGLEEQIHQAVARWPLRPVSWRFGARVVEKAARVRIHFASSCPDADNLISRHQYGAEPEPLRARKPTDLIDLSRIDAANMF